MGCQAESNERAAAEWRFMRSPTSRPGIVPFSTSQCPPTMTWSARCAPHRTSAASGSPLPCTADLLILGGSICDDPSLLWSPDSQRTIVQEGRVIAGSKAAI